MSNDNEGLEPARETPPLKREETPLDAALISSVQLLRGRSCVHIEHGGGLYTLRATRSGKLILTK